MVRLLLWVQLMMYSSKNCWPIREKPKLLFCKVAEVVVAIASGSLLIMFVIGVKKVDDDDSFASEVEPDSAGIVR